MTVSKKGLPKLNVPMDNLIATVAITIFSMSWKAVSADVATRKRRAVSQARNVVLDSCSDVNSLIGAVATQKQFCGGS
jgi:hypothetical protein